MSYLRQNLLPLIIGLSAILVGIAAVVVIVDRVTGDDDDDRVLRIRQFELRFDDDRDDDRDDDHEGFDLFRALRDGDEDGADFSQLLALLAAVLGVDRDGPNEAGRALQAFAERAFTPARQAGAVPPRTAGVAPQLGVTVEQSPDGVRVTGVQRGSGAAEAGLREGDVLTHFEGHRVRALGELRELIATFEPGDIVGVRVRRGDRPVDIRVRLTAMPQTQRLPVEPPLARQSDEARAFEARLGEQGRMIEELTRQLRALTRNIEASRSGGDQPRGTPPALDGDAEQPSVFFGRVADLSDASITLMGSEGSVTLGLTGETARLGSDGVETGDLVTALVVDREVRILIVVG